MSKVKREVITIGADPEFALFEPKTERLISANDVYHPKNPNSIDCEFGFDGHSATGEIRPKPTDTPKKAVQMIKRLLERNKKKYPQAYRYNLRASSSRIQLGGHIHFGNQKFLSPNGGLSIIGKTLVHNLDNLLAFPSMYLENEQHGQSRRSTSYGSFGDSRTADWGFEYRTLSSYIGCQELTSFMFYLGYAIADATLSFNYKCKELVQTAGFSYAFQNQARELLRPHLAYVFKEQKKLPLYKEKKDYKDNIDMFQGSVKEEVPLFECEIKKGWDIEFDIADFWKVEKLETLLEKITKLLIAIHTMKKKNFEPVIYKFVSGSQKDIGCPEIAQRVNIALNNLIDKDVLKSQAWKKLKIYGLKESRGNEVWVAPSCLHGQKRREQLLAYLWEIASEFTHETKIEDIQFTRDTQYRSMALGRKLREENLLIAETMIVIALLMTNRDLFKQTQEVKGKTKKLLVTKHKVVDTVVKNLKNTKEFKANVPNNKTDKLNGVELPLLYDLNMSYNQLHHAVMRLDSDEQIEVANICNRNFDGTLEEVLKTKCISACSRNQIINEIPMKELCPAHLSGAIRNLTNNLPAIDDYGWGHIFEPSRGVECENCGEQVSMDLYCEDCDRCEECCMCNYCGGCGNSVDSSDWCSACDKCHECCTYCSFCDSHECNHRTCTGCHEDVHLDNMCGESDCNRCESCSHELDCPNYEEAEDEPEPSGSTSSSGTSTSASTSPTVPPIYTYTREDDDTEGSTE